MPEIATSGMGVGTKYPFRVGLVTSVGARAVKRGGASDSLNWLTRGDRIELRPGQAYIGTASVNQGLGKTSGLRKVTDALGVEQLFGTYGQSLKYFDLPTQEWIEVGTNLLGAAVVNSAGLSSEDISLAEYVSQAGNQLWVNSPNCAGVFKLMVANPQNPVNQYLAGSNYQGHIKIDTARTFLWGTNKDKTGVFGSYVDAQNYTTVTAETIGTANGLNATFAATLAQAGGRKTVFGVSVTAGAVTLTDNQNGLLSATDGSTGTINYVTGAVSVTFATPPAITTLVTATYQYEDSANNGIADFTKSSPRTAGQGFYFPQGDGGSALQNILGYDGTYYCMHLKKTWALTLGANDTTATNLPYRFLVGLPNMRAAVETDQGIFYIDDTRPDEIKVRVLTYGKNGLRVIPVPVSNNLILQNYLFDQSAAVMWGDLILFSCRTTDSTINNRMLCYNRLWKAWDILDYYANFFEIYNGQLVAADSVSNNFMTLFSGWDDLGSAIDNYWISNDDTLDIEGLKDTKKIYLEGDIAPDQSFDVYLSFDNTPFVKVGTIAGNGDYVDKTSSVTLGGTLLGAKTIGGNINEPVAYHYETLIEINTDRFEYARLKIVATGIGYVSLRTSKYWDVRYKGKRVPLKYRQQLKYPKNYPTI